MRGHEKIGNAAKRRRQSLSGDAHPTQQFVNPYVDSSSGDDHLAVSFDDVMVANMLRQLKDEITPIMKNAHQHSFEPRPAMNKARKIEMRRAAFGTTLIALQWAYSKLLHETFESQWSSEVAANVRNLADAVVWKLTTNCKESAVVDVKGLIVEMLEHLLDEFKWEKILKIVESAADVARTEKAKAYQETRACQNQLRATRNSGD